MTERRSTITVGWRPAGAPARRFDDYAAVAASAPPAPQPAPRRPIDSRQAIERRGIESRLENWSRWVRSSDGPRAAASMTGAICDSLRRAAEGSPSPINLEARAIDPVDAVLIGRSMVHITLDQRRLLGQVYIEAAKFGHSKGFIAALLRFPPLEFDRRLAAAHAAIEAAAATKSHNSNSQLFP